MTDHSKCDHAKTKSARAACRRQRKSRVFADSFALANAYAINDMWGTLNSRQEPLLNRYEVAHTTCEYCEQQAPCFMFAHLGLNVCGPCERMYDVHVYEEEYEK